MYSYVKFNEESISIIGILLSSRLANTHLFLRTTFDYMDDNLGSTRPNSFFQLSYKFHRVEN